MNPTFPEGPRTGAPSTSTVPAVRGSSPETTDSSVDLPQPEGPTTLQNSPGAMSMSTRRRASTSPSGA